jgi:hypothetical protein
MLLQNVVSWTLAQIAAPAEVTKQAARALDCCLAELESTASSSPVASFSGLNADGFPIEFAFSSRDEALRFTAEVATADLPAEAHLARAVALVQALSAQTLPAELVAQLCHLQSQGALRWGASISGRHARDKSTYKLYAEVPCSQAPLPLPLYAPLQAARLQQPPRLVMVGYEAESQRQELYFRSEGLVPGELTRIVHEVGLATRQRELEQAVEAAWDGSAEAAMARCWGLSLAGPRQGPCQALSLFKEANQVLGGDANTRSRLLALVEKLGVGRLDAYARLSASLAARAGSGAHGMLALTVAHGHSLEVRIGLSPAAAFRSTTRLLPT